MREKEKQIKKDLADGLNTIGGENDSLPALRKEEQPEKKCETQHRKRSPVSYENSGNDPLGARSIDTVKLSDGKEWAMRMYENGFSYKTISNYKRSLKASFYMAIEDDLYQKKSFQLQIE